ncbi:hypothetical protein D0867_00898 [Hortaea werneckii]|uniref:Uncharacterized protein n=1 Tax=Hortaea werneckii TaxID=91943 RepID=A0A3M7AC91_HORWE|nr:hypothetical protein D0867_00898 [Hortaea werneckii]
MAFQAIVDSFPMSPVDPPCSLFLSSLDDSVFADENGSRSVTQAQPAKVFRFQDLPPEMRNQICKYALVPDNNNRLRFMPGKSGGNVHEGVRLLLLLKNLEEVRLEGDADRLAAYFAENMRSDDRVPKIFNSGRRVRWRNGVAVTAPGTWRTKRQRAHASKDGDLHA